MINDSSGMHCESCGKEISKTAPQLALADSTDIFEGSYKRFCCYFCLLMHILKEMRATSFEFTQGDAKIVYKKAKDTTADCEIGTMHNEMAEAVSKFYRSQF